MPCIVDNYAEYNTKSVQLYDAIQEYNAAGCTKRAIAKILHCSRNTVTQYLNGDYMNKIIERFHIDVAIYRSSTAEAIQKKKTLQKYDHLSRSGIFRYLWMNAELTEVHVNYLMQNYPVLRELLVYVREFGEIYQRSSMPRLYLFINKYKTSSIKELSRFATGLEKDLDAVENSVASSLSNGFVEGTNSKLKMVKRTMYGRCNKALLETKMMYGKAIYYG